MTALEVRNVVLYALAVLAGSLAAGLAVLATQLAGADPINWRPVLAAALGPLITGLGASQLTRVGSTAIAAQVDYLQTQGMPKREMVVLHQDEAVPALAGALTPSQVQQVADELEARMKAERAAEDREAGDAGGARGTDELISRRPRWLLPDPHDPVTGTPPLPPEREGRG